MVILPQKHPRYLLINNALEYVWLRIALYRTLTPQSSECEKDGRPIAGSPRVWREGGGGDILFNFFFDS